MVHIGVCVLSILVAFAVALLGMKFRSVPIIEIRFGIASRLIAANSNDFCCQTLKIFRSIHEQLCSRLSIVGS